MRRALETAYPPTEVSRGRPSVIDRESELLAPLLQDVVVHASISYERRNARREPGHLIFAFEGAQLDVVGAFLSCLQFDQLPTLSGVEPAGRAVGARLDAHHVRPLAEHPPDEVVRELFAVVELVETEAGLAVDDCHRHGPVTLRGELVLEDLLDVAGLGCMELIVALCWVIATGGDAAGGREQLRALVDDWEAHIDVVE